MNSLKEEVKPIIQAYMPYSYVPDNFIRHGGNLSLLNDQIRWWFKRQLREDL